MRNARIFRSLYRLPHPNLNLEGFVLRVTC